MRWVRIAKVGFGSSSGQIWVQEISGPVPKKSRFPPKVFGVKLNPSLTSRKQSDVIEIKFLTAIGRADLKIYIYIQFIHYKLSTH